MYKVFVESIFQSFFIELKTSTSKGQILFENEQLLPNNYNHYQFKRKL